MCGRHRLSESAQNPLWGFQEASGPASRGAFSISLVILLISITVTTIVSLKQSYLRYGVRTVVGHISLSNAGVWSEEIIVLNRVWHPS